MAIRCGDIINLPSLKKIKLVGGTGGLDRNVRWIYAVEILEDTLQVSHWLNGGELLFWTGKESKDNAGLLVDLLNSLKEKDIAGIVVFTGPYIQTIPEAAIKQADELRIPLFELPWEVRLVEVTHEICSAVIMKEMEEKSLRNLLENILFSNFESSESFTNITSAYGYQLLEPYRLIVVDIDDFEQFLNQNELKDESDVIALKNLFQKTVQSALMKNNHKALYMSRSDSIIILLSGHITGDAGVVKLIDDLRHVLRERESPFTVSVGIGDCYGELNEVKKSLHEAEQALQVAKFTNGKNAACFYHQIGVYRILLGFGDQQQLENMVREYLGKLIQYDHMNKTELVTTLEVYLSE